MKKQGRKQKRTFIKTCQCGCGTEFKTNREAQKYFDRSHAAKHQMSQRNQYGENNPNWGGGVVRHPKGYLEELCRSHPKVQHTKRKYVLQHILVMERALGRYLREDEVVHHKNFIRDDNRLENLELMRKKDHDRLHAEIRKIFRETGQLPFSTISTSVPCRFYI